MFYHNINPSIISLGPFEIRYYGLMYVIAFLVAYLFLRHIEKKSLHGFKDGFADELLFNLILGLIIGARIFYCLVYNPGYYLSHPLDILFVWKGGLSFHGGLLGCTVAAYLFSRKTKIPLLKLGDLMIIPASLGLAFGRLGNFINGELVGTITDVPWGFNFNQETNLTGESIFRHPSQLYEMVKNIFIFTTLSILFKKDKKNIRPDGFYFFLFVIMYGILRFTVGFFRAPDNQLGYLLMGLTMGQILNIIMIIVGVTGFYLIHKKINKDIHRKIKS